MLKSRQEQAALPRPRSAEPVAEAEQTAQRISTPQQPLGEPGRPLNRRSSFHVGATWTAGALLAIAAGYAVVVAADVLVLVGLAFFIAVGLQPLVVFLVRRGLPRAVGVSVVVVCALLVLGGIVAAGITPVLDEGSRLTEQISGYLHGLNDQHTAVGRLNQRFHLVDQLRVLFGGDQAAGTTMTTIAVKGVTNAGIVAVLSVYFLADLPRARRALYRLAPASRRPRVILIGDKVYEKVGAYLLGNVLISVITAAATVVWLVVCHVPYALLLAIVVAALDLVPVAGSLIAGALVTLVAVTVSVPVGVATLGFFLVYKLIEDYVLVPKIIGRAVAVPAVVTVLAVLLGVTLLGPIGALIAIPLAAALLLIVREVAIPRLDQA
jgi:predicted PurR-regulated permease PerM